METLASLRLRLSPDCDCIEHWRTVVNRLSIRILTPASSRFAITHDSPGQVIASLVRQNCEILFLGYYPCERSALKRERGRVSDQQWLTSRKTFVSCAVKSTPSVTVKLVSAVRTFSAAQLPDRPPPTRLIPRNLLPVNRSISKSVPAMARTRTVHSSSASKHRLIVPIPNVNPLSRA